MENVENRYDANLPFTIRCAMWLQDVNNKNIGLQGLNFAIAGKFKSCTGPKLTKFILSKGGQVMGSIRYNTHILIAGDYSQDGRSTV